MKRQLSFAMLVMLLGSLLAACGGASTGGTTATQAPAAAPTEAAAAPTTAPTEAAAAEPTAAPTTAAA